MGSVVSLIDCGKVRDCGVKKVVHVALLLL